MVGFARHLTASRLPVRRAFALLMAMSLLAACGGTPTVGPAASSAIVTGSPTASLLPPQDSGASNAALGDPGTLPGPLKDPETGSVPAAETTPALGGHLTLGTAGTPSSKLVGATGGTVSTEGLSISLPAAALSADTTFSVTSSPIDGLSASGDYGGAVAPITPLYAVDNGGADLSAPATLTLSYNLPDQVPAGASPMAFYYDPTKGTLSPLTTLSAGDGKLTVLATHFSDVVGALVDWTKIPTVADSGFRPGVDDWEFDNYGSYVAPGGQCEGQSLSEIWYYVDQRQAAGASPLYGLYDNNGAPDKTPTFWSDDSQGYRLVASVHADPIVNLATYLMFRNSQWAAADNRLTYDDFRAAIALSGQPQMIRISPDGIAGGHTMVVYRVTPTRIYVADPNYVGQLRSIPYDAATGVMSPYSSGASASSIAANGDTSYTHFAYVPWLSARTTAAIAARWSQFEANGAGSTTFPTYGLLYLAGKDADGKEIWEPLTDGLTTDQAKLTIQVSKLSDQSATVLGIYAGTSSTKLGKWTWKQTLNLAPGSNPFGLLIYAKKDATWQYVDFVRLNINLGPAASPSPASGAGWVLSSGKAATDYPADSSSSSIGNAFSPADGHIALDSWSPKAENGNIVVGSRQDTNATMTWNSPPSSANPGDTWNATLSVDPGCPLIMPLQATISATPEISSGLGGVTVAHLEQQPCKDAGTASGTFTFPAQNDPKWPKGSFTIEAYLELQGVSGGYYTYTYTWQGQ